MLHPAQIWLSRQFDPVRKALGKPAVYVGYPEPQLETEPQIVGCRPALFDQDHLSRVTKCGFKKSLAELADVLMATSYREAPLATYHVGEATVLGGTIFTGTKRILHSKQVKAGVRDALYAHPSLNDAVLINSMQGLRYFGHWLSDDVSAFEAFRNDPRVISLPLPTWSDIDPYLELFDQQWHQQSVIRAKSLTLVRDLGFSRGKAQRYRALRGRFRSRLRSSNASGKVVFLRRGPSGDPREIVNAANLERRLSDAGVAIVTAEGGKDFLAAIVDASVIITIEGSQDRHALYSLREGGGMLTLAPPDRFYVATHEWARNLDMHSGIVIGVGAEGGFIIDPDEVLRMADRLLELTENRADV